MDRERYVLALCFWTSALQYLTLVENVSRATVSQGNVWTLVRDYGDSGITADEYRNATRWSDHSIIIPLLFNLLHGIELLAKGFLLADPDETVDKNHKISELRNRVHDKFPNETILNSFLSKYTDESHVPELVSRFLDRNGLSVDRLYPALRYPSPDFVATHQYASLKYQGEAGTPFFADLVDDIKELVIAAVDLGRRLETAGE